ncbi:exocyst subunit SEC5 [Paracoccidioides brasiliensis Pb18]|uniref:Exocyst complex component SEC5 n=1 Tax=Paracoccidioides brasiliensis (strain Pb18) TaxID=502780 RepID=C1G6K1_PARBD|nr:exocyst subunit SEC5 [Paracoccidioides brasiliensis Pb18]EEH46708.1 hypothetical protein PADG_02806 [Paracoccidioides brasiliensis Pb18]ODH50381.1 hypothetical protein GX48_03496 [Paracoccidioides brasiliensis]
MAAFDTDVIVYYNIPTLYPEEWPAELEESDDSDGEESQPSGVPSSTAQRRKSRYAALQRHGSDRRSIVPGSQRTGDGRDNLVQKDEPDPLGSFESVVRMLKQRGIADDDVRVRNRYLLSSTTFSPALFLSQTHSSDSTQSLLEGLDFLSRSIDQKSASLKVLVESNFERFVRAKATIDNVYTEMRNQGAQPDESPHRSHSRNTSRSGSHIRNYSTGAAVRSISAERLQKNSLTKESEYGVKGIRVPLMEASGKAEEVWGPALGGRQREDGLKSVIETLEQHREIYEIGSNLVRSIKQRDYDAIIDQYNRSRRHAIDAKLIADRATTTKRPLTDKQVHLILVTGRMWMDVEKQIQAFKRDLWRRLSSVPTHTSTMSLNGPFEEHMELISTLLELGVDDNPVWVWLLGRYDYLKTTILAFCERSKVEIEILRRRLANGEKPTPQAVVPYIHLSNRDGVATSQDLLDTEPVLELWECIHTYLKKLLSLEGGLLGDVIEFWDTTKSFIDGSKQKLLPAGFEGESRKHHRLSSGGVEDLKNGVIELVNLIRDSAVSIFADPPIDDISLLFSPLPATPNTPLTGITPTDSRFRIDPKDIPPLSPRKGEAWEDFAFWPPYSNSLSGVHYLSQFLILIGTAASEMAAMSPISSGSSTYDKLKLLVSGTRERSVRAVCAAWNKDAESIKYLEDWTRDPERKDMTKMPGLFVAFESAVLSGMQKILYISEAMTKSLAGDVVTPPPAKLLQMVRSQFVTSVYKALSGLVENAEHPVTTEGDNEWVLVGPVVRIGGLDISSSISPSSGIDSNNRNVRMLLTLSNLKALLTDYVPQLVSNFETAFSVKLTEESKTIRDVLGQIDTRLFQSYTRPMTTTLNSTILEGISAPDWVPSTSRPDQVCPYVYATMLNLVLVHTEVSTTLPTGSQNSSGAPASSLTNEILSHLLTQVSSSLLNAFMQRPKYSLPALMQATLDTEFIAQTLSQYATEEASKIQSQIYLELDRRTNNDARAKLQDELGEMRSVLKRLREATRGEFACFKKARNGGKKQ